MLKGVILSVEEVDLVGQFANGLFVRFVGVLDAEEFEVLPAFVDAVKSLDFFLSLVDLLLQVEEFGFVGRGKFADIF